MPSSLESHAEGEFAELQVARAVLALQLCPVLEQQAGKRLILLLFSVLVIF